MWVFFAKILVSQHSYTLQNCSNFKSNFSFNNNRSLEIHDHFRTRGNASYNDLSQLINTLSNKDFACLTKFKLRKIPTSNQLCRCQCKQGWQSCWYCIDTDFWDSSRWIAKIYLCQGHGNWIKGVAQYQIASGRSKELCQYDTSL